MSMNTERDYEELLDEAYGLPNGHAKLQLLEEAARIADSLGEVEAGYEIRGEIVETASFSGFPRTALVAFSWQLGQFDKNPDMYDEWTLLWSYKWILGNVAAFPEIERAQIDSLLEDMRRRYLEAGYSDYAYHYYRFVLAIDYGELDEAEQALNQLKTMERDEMADCDACEQNEFVDFWAQRQNDEQTIQMAQPIIKGGMSCAEVPHVTLPKVLMPLYRQGKQAEADKYQKKSYKLIHDNTDFVQSIGEHIGYLTVTDPYKALELFEKHAHWTDLNEAPIDKMLFHAYTSGMFKRLAQETVQFNVKLPSSYPHPEHATDVNRLAAYYGELATDVARKLDLRNGNSYQSEHVKRLMDTV